MTVTVRALAWACLWGVLLVPARVDAGLGVRHLHTDAGGVGWYEATSAHNGPDGTLLRILRPTTPALGRSERFLYILPVIPDVDVEDEFGDGLEALRALDAHNAYNATIVAPSFQVVPWYANHAWLATRQYERFMVEDLVPWVQANLSGTGNGEHWLVGFSKSGFGAVTLLMRNPSVFAAAAVWDPPVGQSDAGVWNMLDNYGTEANFQQGYRLTGEWIAARRDSFLAAPRLWLSDDYATYHGVETFRDEVLALAERLSESGVQYVLEGGATRIHTWTSGWLPHAVAGLERMRYGTRDDFNRADGDLGPRWAMDPFWGSGFGLAGNQVTAGAGAGGAYYWAAEPPDADQYAQVTLTAPAGDWIGVAVRASASPSQGYWVAVKPEGAFLYALVGGAFHLLAQDATVWAAGDVLRLEVRTVAPGTARLDLLRNGAVLLSHHDTVHVIAGGQPGLGLHAAAPIVLDDWYGGSLSVPPPAVLPPPPSQAPPLPPLPPPPPPPPDPEPDPTPSDAVDSFNRADGGLGPDWTIDAWWGNGIRLAAHRVTASPGSGGAHYWTAEPADPDQYAQVTLTALAGEWIGVAVRASAPPSQGYWVAVKPGGAFLYALADGAFHLLAQDPTAWVAGDVLRLEVRTVAPSTARLELYRNATLVMVHDDTTHFIAAGQPGIGMHAAATLSLDEWYGGTLDTPSSLPPPPPPPPPADPTPSEALDGFDRAAGGLGPDWTIDPWWGDGIRLAGHQVTASPGSGGAYYWTAEPADPDQYAQVTLASLAGDWIGVAVRASASPSQGYWLAVKPEGAFLYALFEGAFHLLAHDPTAWAAGDVLRVEVRTVAPGTARLDVQRNGAVVVSHDDSAHFIATGQPGLGMHATGTIALDDWSGGTLEQPIPTP